MELEQTVHSSQLTRQHLSIKFETLKNQRVEDKYKGQSALERQIREKEDELKAITNDIDRLRNYQQVSGGESAAADLNKDLEAIKAFVREAVGKQEGTASPNQDLNELAVMIPREIDRVEEKILKLRQELTSMQSL